MDRGFRLFCLGIRNSRDVSGENLHFVLGTLKDGCYLVDLNELVLLLKLLFEYSLF